MRIGYTHV
jgi:hypothetical protein